METDKNLHLGALLVTLTWSWLTGQPLSETPAHRFPSFPGSLPRVATRGQPCARITKSSNYSPGLGFWVRSAVMGDGKKANYDLADSFLEL